MNLCLADSHSCVIYVDIFSYFSFNISYILMLVFSFNKVYEKKKKIRHEQVLRKLEMCYQGVDV